MSHPDVGMGIAAEQALLRVHEIFFSLQGESSRVGLPTVFVRLTGCPLRCHYCDTAYAFQGGQRYTVEQVIAEVARYDARYVTVTGGEPLAQKASLLLMQRLCDQQYSVSLETSGYLDICSVDARVSVILDIKTPGSGEEVKNLWQNLVHLKACDEVKFVLNGREDYVWAKQIMARYRLHEVCGILFSPVYQVLHPQQLADWILEDALPVRLQIQLHKLLWGEEPGH